MEVLNKILPLILIAIMSMNLSGCGNTGADGSQPAETSSATIVTDENGNKVATAADFSKVTICGTEFTMPCKASDFTGDFSVSDKPTYENDTWYTIYYKDVPVGYIYYKPERQYDLETSFPPAINLWSNDNTVSYSINEVILPTSYNELINHFGKPNRELKSENSVSLFYNVNSVISCVVFDGNNKDYINSIEYIFYEEEK